MGICQSKSVLSASFLGAVCGLVLQIAQELDLYDVASITVRGIVSGRFPTL